MGRPIERPEQNKKRLYACHSIRLIALISPNPVRKILLYIGRNKTSECCGPRKGGFMFLYESCLGKMIYDL